MRMTVSPVFTHRAVAGSVQPGLAHQRDPVLQGGCGLVRPEHQPRRPLPLQTGQQDVKKDRRLDDSRCVKLTP